MISETCRRATRLALASAVLGLFTACASGPTASPSDPFEPMNRSIDRFNTALDEAALKPLATAYKTHTPDPVPYTPLTLPTNQQVYIPAVTLSYQNKNQ